jgi:arginine decarboxylase
MRKDVDKAVRSGRITAKEARQFLRFYEDGMDGYTYLEE